MKLLVLGGAGYIGSHTATELLDNGHEVVIADNLVTGYREAIPEKATFYQGDLRDKDFLVDLLTKEKVEAVVASDEKARKILGWEPEIKDLANIIQSAWNWHSKHPDGYNKKETEVR